MAVQKRFINLNFKIKFTYFLNFKNKELKNFVVYSRSVNKFIKNDIDYSNWKNVNNYYLKDIQFYKKFMHPQIFTWGYIKYINNKKMWLGIYNSITHSSKSIGNDNILINSGSSFDNIKPSYYNVSNIAISNTFNVLKPQPNYSSEEIIKYLEGDFDVQNKINLNFEKKIDTIISNENIMSIINPNIKFMIQQHFDNCFETAKGVCSQCILIDQKYGIIKIISENI